jgi:hypothetical protein
VVFYVDINVDEGASINIDHSWPGDLTEEEAMRSTIQPFLRSEGGQAEQGAEGMLA